ncbi:MAG: adenine phosphoribosyltransferase [Candidatus Lokiarchaeota archaeon]|nr:adenine phosphoribosyltransferase [Candidatus Lokiarchaeota archaeon]
MAGNLTQLEQIKSRLRCIELLKILKKRMTYEELSKILKVRPQLRGESKNDSTPRPLPITVLNRYIRGHVLPNAERTEEMLKILEKETDLVKEVRNRLKFDNGYFDNTALLGDTLLLRYIARVMTQKFARDGITKVLTAAADGIPIGTHIANEMEVDLVIAKRVREVGVKEFVEETYIPSFSGTRMSLYIPRYSFSKKDRVLVVDDVVRSGETQRALVNIVKKSGAEVLGLFILVAIGDSWREEIVLPEEKIATILNLPSNRQ